MFWIVLAIGAAAVGYQVWMRTAVPEDAPVIGVSADTAWHSRVGITSRTYEIALTRAGGHYYEVRPGEASPRAVLDAKETTDGEG